MALADDLKPLLTNIRAIPGSLGLRPHTVAIVETDWSGEHTGEGEKAQFQTSITEADGQPPKVRWLSDKELAVAGLPDGSVQIGPITPSNGTIGTLLATLSGTAMLAGQTRHVLITGPKHPNGALYVIREISADHALHYTMRVTPVSAA
jgi:hypothetical protein